MAFRPLFGGPTGSSGIFGSTSTAQPTTQNPFSSQPSGFGQQSQSLPGFGNTPSYSATSDQDGASTIQLQSISAMPAYRTKSFEELRLEDYQRGRKGPTGFGSGGQLTQSFQQAPSVPSGGVFGGSSTIFGQAQATNQFSAQHGQDFFGQPSQPQQPALGFGQAPGSTFGQPTPTQPSGFSFGSNQSLPAPTQSNPFAGFGAAGASQQTSLFNQPQQSSTLPAQPLFGQSSAMQPSSFAANKPPSFGGVPPISTPSFNLQAQPVSTQLQPSSGSQSSSLFPSIQNAPSSFQFNPIQQSTQQQQPQGTNTAPFSFNPPSTAPRPTNLSFPSLTAPTSFGGLFGGAALPAPSAFNLPLINPPTSTQTPSTPINTLNPPLPAALKVTTNLNVPIATKTTAPGRTPAKFTPRSTLKLKPRMTSEASVRPPIISGTIVPRRSVKQLYVEPVAVDALKQSTTAASLAQSVVKTSSTPVLASLPSVAAEAAADSSTLHYGDFYTNPSESTLRNYSPKQLSSVSGLTIGQRGVGQMQFLEPVDLTDIDLDTIFEDTVIFEPRQVTVYPEDREIPKPPVGSGLNRPAQVRLERCWPLSRSTREPITDINNDRLTKHVERLKTVEGTTFVDFILETGTWIFNVEHFSRYAMPIEDETPDEEIKASHVNIKAQSEAEYNNVRSIRQNSDEKFGDLDMTLSDAKILNPSAGMHASPPEMTKTTVGWPYSSTCRRAANLDTIQRMPLKIESYERSIASTRADCFFDSRLAMARSFRAGFAPDGRIATVASNSFSKITLHLASHTENIDLLESTIMALFESSSIISENDTVNPVNFDFKPFHSILALLSEKSRMSYREKLIWQLASCLWDPMDLDSISPIDDYQKQLGRRDRLTAWLQSAIHEFPGDRAKSPLFYRLFLFDLKDAAELAARNGDVRLATLIPLVGSCGNIKSLLRQQLDHWTSHSDILKYIPTHIIKVYQLLVGDVKVFADELSWIQTFALLFWYGNRESHNLLTDSMTQFKALLTKSKHAEPLINNRVDVLFSLLSVYYNGEDLNRSFEKAVHPLSIGTDPNDWRLSWCLAIILSTKGIISMTLSSLTCIAFHLLAQLEQVGLWHLAIFVIMATFSGKTCNSLIYEILTRNVRIDSELPLLSLNGHKYKTCEQFVTGKLGISNRIILKAKALRSKYLNLPREEFKYWAGSGKHSRAHHILVTLLGPEAMIAGEEESLEALLGILDQTYIPDWKQGGRIFHEFIMIKRLLAHTKATNIAGLSTVLSRLHDFMYELGVVRSRWVLLKQRIALAEISSQVCEMMLEASTLIGTTPKVELVAKLPMPEDQRMMLIHTMATDLISM